MGPLTLWRGITLIFLVAYWRKRRYAKRRLAEMEDAEELSEEPPQEPPAG
jgi:uncharacterized protein YjiS (DUF1127 family)